MQGSWDFEFIYWEQRGVSDQLALESDDDDTGALHPHCGPPEANFVNCCTLQIEVRAIVPMASALFGDL